MGLELGAGLELRAGSRPGAAVGLTVRSARAGRWSARTVTAIQTGQVASRQTAGGAVTAIGAAVEAARWRRRVRQKMRAATARVAATARAGSLARSKAWLASGPRSRPRTR